MGEGEGELFGDGGIGHHDAGSLMGGGGKSSVICWCLSCDEQLTTAYRNATTLNTIFNNDVI